MVVHVLEHCVWYKVACLLREFEYCVCILREPSMELDAYAGGEEYKLIWAYSPTMYKTKH